MLVDIAHEPTDKCGVYRNKVPWGTAHLLWRSRLKVGWRASRRSVAAGRDEVWRACRRERAMQAAMWESRGGGLQRSYEASAKATFREGASPTLDTIPRPCHSGASRTTKFTTGHETNLCRKPQSDCEVQSWTRHQSVARLSGLLSLEVANAPRGAASWAKPSGDKRENHVGPRGERNERSLVR